MYNAFINAIKPTMEILYFIAGIIVSITAILALKQIKIMKHTAEIQSKRDALTITSEQCVNYMTNIIKLQNEFNRSLKENQIHFLDGWEVTISDNEISLKHDGKIDYSNFDKMNYATVYNAMEAFATYFISKVADESVAFNSLGTTYVNTTEHYLPILLEVNEDGYFRNIVNLYVLWTKRMISIDLQEQQENLKRKMKNYHTEVIKPIGVE